MSFPSFTDSETTCVAKSRTYSAAADYGTYETACASYTTTISYEVPAGTYLSNVYMTMKGSSDNSGIIYTLWVDNNWTGTNNDTYYMMRMSHQGNATPPNAFIQFQDANEVSYLFYFAGKTIGYVTNGAVGGDQDKKLRLSVNGTDYYVPLNTA